MEEVFVVFLTYKSTPSFKIICYYNTVASSALLMHSDTELFLQSLKSSRVSNTSVSAYNSAEATEH